MSSAEIRWVSDEGRAVEFARARRVPGGRAGCGRVSMQGLGRQLALQAVLLVAREIAGAGGLVGIVANPVGREVAEEIVDIGRRARGLPKVGAASGR